jgi:hypothetical protein
MIILCVHVHRVIITAMVLTTLAVLISGQLSVLVNGVWLFSTLHVTFPWLSYTSVLCSFTTKSFSLLSPPASKIAHHLNSLIATLPC